MLAAIVAAVFILSSPQFATGDSLSSTLVWNRDGCSGANRSPALHWTSPPARTKSFALGVFDPDAGPAGWWHWIVYDIPTERRELPAALSASYAGVGQGTNDFGTSGYGGPCPPSGPAHHYIFTLYALDIARLPVSAPPHGPAFLNLARKHTIATATLTGLYRR